MSQSLAPLSCDVCSIAVDEWFRHEPISTGGNNVPIVVWPSSWSKIGLCQTSEASLLNIYTPSMPICKSFWACSLFPNCKLSYRVRIHSLPFARSTAPLRPRSRSSLPQNCWRLRLPPKSPASLGPSNLSSTSL